MTETECPTCGRTDFKNEHGLNIHHGRQHGGSLAKVELECEICGGGFEVVPSITDQRRTCGYECRGKLNTRENSGKDHVQYKERVTLECESCGDEFSVYPFQAEDRRFCSRSCTWEVTGEDHWHYRKKEVECANCGESIERYPCRIKRSENLFCSVDCVSEWQSENIVGESHPNYTGGPAKYGPGWNEKKRRAVRKRDDFKCQDCGMTQEEHREQYSERLHVHHIIPAREFDDSEECNSMDNLVTLCMSHHRWKWEQMPGLRPT